MGGEVVHQRGEDGEGEPVEGTAARVAGERVKGEDLGRREGERRRARPATGGGGVGEHGGDR